MEMLEEVIERIDTKANEMYDWLKDVRDYIDKTLLETKHDGKIDAYDLAERVNNLTLPFFWAKGDVQVIAALCGIRDRSEQK